jgi:hypothetical protein
MVVRPMDVRVCRKVACIKGSDGSGNQDMLYSSSFIGLR